MNFDSLLAQYLYKHKILNLPGIGTFEADSTVYSPDENEKQKPSFRGISFRNIPVTQADDDLIEFIKMQTGKMKPLAISDLESYLTLGKQFLYIGKPFYLEGIGTLSLTKEGEFVFTPGEFVTTKLEDPNVERSEGKKRSVYEEDRLLQESKNNIFKIIFLLIGIIAAIGLIGYGGYFLYDRFVNRQSSTDINSPVNTLADSTTAAPSTDSLPSSNRQTGTDPIMQNADFSDRPETKLYKFVVITTDDKIRALNALNFYGSNKIKLETADSVLYKLYYLIPATAADTLRIRDSLNKRHYGNTNTIRVTIE